MAVEALHLFALLAGERLCLASKLFALVCVTLYLAIVLPGQKSGFRAGLRPDSNREGLKIGPKRAHLEALPTRIRQKSGHAAGLPARNIGELRLEKRISVNAAQDPEPLRMNPRGAPLTL